MHQRVDPATGLAHRAAEDLPVKVAGHAHDDALHRHRNPPALRQIPSGVPHVQPCARRNSTNPVEIQGGVNKRAWPKDMMRAVMLLGAALTCEAFVPLGQTLPAARSKLALSAPGPGRTLRRAGALQTRAHLDPSHAFNVADTLQVRGCVRPRGTQARRSVLRGPLGVPAVLRIASWGLVVAAAACKWLIAQLCAWAGRSDARPGGS